MQIQDSPALMEQKASDHNEKYSNALAKFY